MGLDKKVIALKIKYVSRAQNRKYFYGNEATEWNNFFTHN
jgi:hypothetical protein